MKAEKIDGSSIAGKRTTLSDVLPLDTPFLVQIFPAYACNFRCNYCIHSLSKEKRGFVANKSMMDFDFYKKCIRDLKEFPRKIKMLRFAATGEPLLHPKIAEMIDYAKKKDVADSLDIVTNGSLLSPKLSDRLIEAGLDWLRISIQGLSSKKYIEVCGAEVVFEQFVKNIEYFYKHRGNTKVYIKIIDYALDEGDEETFYKVFGEMSDKIAVEHLTPAVSDIDYSKLTEKPLDISQNGNPVQMAEICPQPFYMMQINPDYNVVPCCSMKTTFICGDAREQSLLDIWRGERLKRFQRASLKHQKNHICKDCETYKFGMFEEDVLDGHEDLLIQRYE